LVASLLLVTLSGCASAPAGVDRDLVNGWPTMSPAAFLAPVVGTCYASTTVDSYRLELRTTTKTESCAVKHASETAYVGTFTGVAAAQTHPPTTSDQVAPWAECEKGAAEYLGEDWHGARADLVMFTPTSSQWEGGARFFRCDLVEVKSDKDVVVPRTASLKDGLRGDRPLALTCARLVDETKDSIGDLASVPCTESHRVEYAGVAVAPAGPYPFDTTSWDQLFNGGCEAVVAKYTGMTVAQLGAHRQLQWIWWGTSELHWVRGDRSARCYVWLPSVPDVRRSVRGLGNVRL